MKKHYEKMCMTPLGTYFEGNLLLGSAVQTASEVVTTPGHEIVPDSFDSETFQLDWEEVNN